MSDTTEITLWFMLSAAAVLAILLFAATKI